MTVLHQAHDLAEAQDRLERCAGTLSLRIVCRLFQVRLLVYMLPSKRTKSGLMPADASSPYALSSSRTPTAPSRSSRGRQGPSRDEFADVKIARRLEAPVGERAVAYEDVVVIAAVV